MSEFNHVKFGLDVSRSQVIDTLGQLFSALELNLATLPDLNELKISGTVAAAPIGETGTSKFIVNFKEHQLEFTSWCRVEDGRSGGPIFIQWFEAKTSDFSMSISLSDNPDLDVYISSFTHYDLLLGLVRNFGARLLNKYYVEVSNSNPDEKESEPVFAETKVPDEKPIESTIEEVLLPVQADTLIHTLTVSESLGYEMYSLIEEHLEDFLATFGIKAYSFNKIQLKHDENGEYQKILKSQSCELNLKLNLNRNPDHKSAQLIINLTLFTPHNYLPIQLQLNAYHSKPNSYLLDSIDVLAPKSAASEELGKKIANDFKTFLMLAKM